MSSSSSFSSFSCSGVTLNTTTYKEFYNTRSIELEFIPILAYHNSEDQIGISKFLPTNIQFAAPTTTSSEHEQKLMEIEKCTRRHEKLHINPATDVVIHVGHKDWQLFQINKKENEDILFQHLNLDINTTTNNNLLENKEELSGFPTPPSSSVSPFLFLNTLIPFVDNDLIPFIQKVKKNINRKVRCIFLLGSQNPQERILIRTAMILLHALISSTLNSRRNEISLIKNSKELYTIIHIVEGLFYSFYYSFSLVFQVKCCGQLNHSTLIQNQISEFHDLLLKTNIISKGEEENLLNEQKTKLKKYTSSQEENQFQLAESNSLLFEKWFNNLHECCQKLEAYLWICLASSSVLQARLSSRFLDFEFTSYSSLLVEYPLMHPCLLTNGKWTTTTTSSSSSSFEREPSLHPNEIKKIFNFKGQNNNTTTNSLFFVQPLITYFIYTFNPHLLKVKRNFSVTKKEQEDKEKTVKKIENNITTTISLSSPSSLVSNNTPFKRRETYDCGKKVKPVSLKKDGTPRKLKNEGPPSAYMLKKLKQKELEAAQAKAGNTVVMATIVDLHNNSRHYSTLTPFQPSFKVPTAPLSLPLMEPERILQAAAKINESLPYNTSTNPTPIPTSNMISVPSKEEILRLSHNLMNRTLPEDPQQYASLYQRDTLFSMNPFPSYTANLIVPVPTNPPTKTETEKETERMYRILQEELQEVKKQLEKEKLKKERGKRKRTTKKDDETDTDSSSDSDSSSSSEEEQQDTVMKVSTS